MRIRGIAAAMAVVVGIVVIPTWSAGAQDGTAGFVNGSGRASARIVKAGPSVAALPIAPTFGVAKADYSGTVGRGEAQPIDWAALEITLPPELIEATPPLRVASTDPGAADGETLTLAGLSEEAAPLAGGTMVQQASATDAPRGQSAIEFPSLEVPGVISLAGGRAEARTEVQGEVREAFATADIPRLDLAGVVAFEGLHWEAVQRTGPGGELLDATGDFTAGSLAIAGVPVAPPTTSDDLAAVIDPLNTALAPTGLRIDLPRVDVQGDVARVTPLALRFEASEEAQTLLGPVFELIEPIRRPALDALLEQLNALNESFELPVEPAGAILALDVVLGVLEGAGQFDLELGGVSAFTEGQAVEIFDLFGGGDRFDTTPTSPAQAAPPPPPASVRGETLESPGGTTTPPDDSRTSVEPPRGSAAPSLDASGPVDRSVASAAWALGIIGTILAATLTGEEYRRMRHRAARARVPPIS